MLLATFISYIAYKYLILPKNTLFPDPKTLGNELWILIILFIYKIFNEVKFPANLKEIRVKKYITQRNRRFRQKFEDKVDQAIALTLQIFRSNVKSLLSFPPHIEKNRILYHSLLPEFDNYCKELIKDITFTIMITEDFNRPFLFRKFENLLCNLLHKPYSQGIMQFTSITPISDNRSIELAIEKIYECFFRILKEEKGIIYLYKITNTIFENYNHCKQYI